MITIRSGSEQTAVSLGTKTMYYVGLWLHGVRIAVSYRTFFSLGKTM